MWSSARPAHLLFSHVPSALPNPMINPTSLLLPGLIFPDSFPRHIVLRSLGLFFPSWNRTPITMEEAFTDAVQLINELQSSGALSQEDADMIAGTTDLESFMAGLKSKTESNYSPKSSAIISIFKGFGARLKYLGGALDIIAQSMPQISGFNPVGIVWGILRAVFQVSWPVRRYPERIIENDGLIDSNCLRYQWICLRAKIGCQK
ncbi:hypothetical protein GQ53DRAFT_405241 [Thozetella sp. PMI_491]|nr:hypothetical protein GQ53DRAFT_405241 [Thozetella sp. PMI_491]